MRLKRWRQESDNGLVKHCIPSIYTGITRTDKGVKEKEKGVKKQTLTELLCSLTRGYESVA